MSTRFLGQTMKRLLMWVSIGLLLSGCPPTATRPPEPTPYGAHTPAQPLGTVEAPQVEPPPTFVPIEHPLLNPYHNFAYWYKGHTHTHTALGPWEKGVRLPEDQVVALYRNAGYDFLGITEHNTVRISDPASSVMVAIPGCESGKDWENHLVALGVDGCPEQCASNDLNLSSLPDCDARENQWRVCQVVTQPLGFGILAHPGSVTSWGIEDGWAPNKVKYVKGYNAVEIVSASNVYTSEWKSVLDQDRQVWAVASDDFHKTEDLGKGWIVVNSARSPTDPGDLLHNMISGNFYAVGRWSCERLSPEQCHERTVWCGEPAVTGHWPRFDGVYDGGPSVHVTGTGALFVRFIDSTGVLTGTRTVGDVDDRQTPMQFSATYDWSSSTGLPSPQVYLRIELEDGCGNVAYSQPLFVKEAGDPALNNAPDCSFGDIQFDCTGNCCEVEMDKHDRQYCHICVPIKAACP